MNDLVWGNPAAARWGLAVLGLLFGFIWLAVWRRATLAELASRGPLPTLLDARGGARLAVRAALILATASLIVLGMMRPQQGTRATELKNLGIDIAVVLDGSKSMMVADVIPDRLQAAKLELHKLLDGTSGGRVGLVPFAGLAFLQTPLTADVDVIKTYLQELRVEDMPRGGTAIGGALIEAVRALVPPDKLEGTLAAQSGDDDRPPEAEQLQDFEGSKHKAILLFTDGEDHEGDPVAVAELARSLGIRIFTVGVGTAQGRPVPLINDEGLAMGTLKGDDGSPLFSELNEGLLRQIAETTGGQYFHLGPTGIGGGLTKAIDQLEKQEYEATFKHLRDDRYQLALVPALILLLIEALLAGRARRRRRRRPVAAAAVAVLLALSVGGCDTGDLFETRHGAVEEGNEALLADRVDEALEAYEEAATQIPERPELDYDRGLALSASGRHDEATQRLLRALETRDSELRGKVYAALGAAYSRWGLEIERTGASGVVAADPNDDPTAEPEPAEPTDPSEAALPKWERAVEHLEKALRTMPTDEDVLRNLEIALLRVDPPCSSRNDEMEPNDRPDQAQVVELAAEEAPGQTGPDGQPVAAPAGAQDELKWKRQLLSCPDDNDWFRVDLQAGDRLSAKITSSDELGQLALELWAPDGSQRLRPKAGVDDVVLDALDYSVGAQGGAYLLRVANVDADEVPYSLDVVMRPACERVDDELEDNDGPEAAATLTPGPLDGLKICPMDDDWYAVTLAEGESLFVFATLTPDEEDASDKEKEADPGQPAPTAPQLELAIRGPMGGLMSEGAPTGEGRVATLLTPGAGRYLIRVSGPTDLEARYSLLTNVVPPCPEGDDQFEDNDTSSTAVDIVKAAAEAAMAQQGGQPGGMAPPQQGGPPPPMLLRICPDDVDWFELTAQPDQPPQVVSAVFEHAKGDLAMTLYDASGGVVQIADESSEEANGEGVALPPAEGEPATYQLKVEGKPLQENFYLLRIDQPQPQQQDSDEQQDEQDEQEQEQDEDEQEQEQNEDEQEQNQEQQPQEDRPQPLEDALDKLDRNPQNLEARQRAQTSPLVNHPPEKDW